MRRKLDNLTSLWKNPLKMKIKNKVKNLIIKNYLTI